MRGKVLGWRCGDTGDTGAVQLHPGSFLTGVKNIPNTAGGVSLYRDLNSPQRCFQNQLGR